MIAGSVSICNPRTKIMKGFSEMENKLSVFQQGNQLYTDSREVAKMIGKDHKNLLRDISGYIDVLSQSSKLSAEGPMGQNPKLDSDKFFVESSYKAGTGKTYPCYPMWMLSTTWKINCLVKLPPVI